MKNLSFSFLLVFLIFTACSNESTPTVTDDTNTETTMSIPKPGLIHNVHFWLKPELNEAERADFLRGLRSLADITHVDHLLIGPPATTEAREVVDNSFSYALIVWFEDIAAQDAYQVDPIHLKFVEDCQQYWDKVVVRDNLVE